MNAPARPCPSCGEPLHVRRYPDPLDGRRMTEQSCTGSCGWKLTWGRMQPDPTPDPDEPLPAASLGEVLRDAHEQYRRDVAELLDGPEGS